MDRQTTLMRRNVVGERIDSRALMEMCHQLERIGSPEGDTVQPVSFTCIELRDDGRV